MDIITIQETKLDSSFPSEQFMLAGYSKPYRLDRNREGGGVLIYVREDIPSKQLTKHNFTKNVEGLFVEINLRKTNLESQRYEGLLLVSLELFESIAEIHG